MMANGYMDRDVQKAFVPRLPGCIEHSTKLGAALHQAHSKRRSMLVGLVNNLVSLSYTSVKYDSADCWSKQEVVWESSSLNSCDANLKDRWHSLLAFNASMFIWAFSVWLLVLLCSLRNLWNFVRAHELSPHSLSDFGFSLELSWPHFLFLQFLHFPLMNAAPFLVFAYFLHRKSTDHLVIDSTAENRVLSLGDVALKTAGTKRIEFFSLGDVAVKTAGTKRMEFFSSGDVALKTAGTMYGASSSFVSSHCSVQVGLLNG